MDTKCAMLSRPKHGEDLFFLTYATATADLSSWTIACLFIRRTAYMEQRFVKYAGP